MYDVFLCHNSQDKPAVIEIAKLLRERGIEPWLDAWELRPGLPWLTSLEMQMEDIRSAAVFVGASGVGPWQRMELNRLLMRFVDQGAPVIPVLLTDAPSSVALPLFLDGMSWVDFRKDSEEMALARLIWGVTGQKPSSNLKPVESVSNYAVRPAKLQEVFCTTGLPDFTYVETSNYRDVENDLSESGKHILIYGPSGSGKTCLITRIMLNEQVRNKDFKYLFVSSLDEDANKSVKDLMDQSLIGNIKIPIVIDDFHVLEFDTRVYIAKKLKQLSDRVFRTKDTTKFILLGISTSPQDLLYSSLDLGRRLGIYEMTPPRSSDLNSLIEQGERKLSIRFSNPGKIAEESSSSFYICQYLCQKICIESKIYETADSLTILNYVVEDIRKYLIKQLSERFKPFLISFVQNSGTSRDDWTPFAAMITVISRLPDSQLTIARISDTSGDFGMAIRAMQDKILPAINSCAKNGGFGKVFHYSENARLLSIEDPTLRYYLNHLDISDFINSVGISSEDRNKILNIDKKINFTEEQLNNNLDLRDTFPQSRREEIFISYSHTDLEWLQMLQIHLKPLIRNKSITVWVDTQIRAGMAWREEIEKAIARAKVAVLLVSPNFLASDFIVENELPPLLNAAKEEGLTIIWVPLRFGLYEETEIAQYQAAHSPNQPISSLSQSEQDKALVDICKKIKLATN